MAVVESISDGGHDTAQLAAPARGAVADQASSAALALSAAALLAACGGGGSASAPGAPASPVTPAPTPVVPEAVTAVTASRFLAQASMGATREQIARVQALGYAGWIDEQMALAPSTTRWDWLVSKGFNAIANKNSEAGADPAIWRKMLSSPDTLRQRVTFALSEILVASIAGFSGGWNTFSAAAWLDLLEAQAFGNYRTLLGQVSTSAPMGEYLTFRGNVKANTNTGALPDENYAREVMQLFTIGLVQLNQDGSARLSGGVATETYTLDDIGGLARVFTGWNYDLTGTTTDLPDFKRKPMTVTASRHESGTKTFLGTTIAAGTSGEESLRIALDALFAHPNIAPNISRQLIMRLVTSNPSAAYVGRIAAVFSNDGSGVKGNLKAVLKAILLDEEARASAKLADPAFGKQREPVLRLCAWARATGATSTADAWTVGNTSDPATRLSQSPLRSGSVFNFFRPGYVPPNSAVGSAGLVAPEFQITNESSVVGYLNYMQNVVKNGAGDVKSTYAALLPLADVAASLVDELNLLLAAGQLSGASTALITTAVNSMTAGTDAARLNRIYAALVLVLAAPEFIIVK
jgi:uncharacterized protein (DUF1800 family)